MFTRRHAQASPSVTLEKGIARLRPVRPKPLKDIREDGQPGMPFPTDAERRAAAVLASIAFAILLAVCLALYLLSRDSRFELSSLQFLFYSELASSSSPARTELFDPFLTPLPMPRRPTESVPRLATPLQHSSEQYMSYLPHSGFHNQRIALENALVLAYILNRTLLIPPVRLGDPPIRYRPSESLRVDVALSSQTGLEHCLHIRDGDATPVPEECTDFWTHTQVPWDWLVDLAPVAHQHSIRLLPRPDLTNAFLEHLGIAPADTFFLDDTTPYQFRLFDLVDDGAPVGPRYSTRIDLPQLAARARAYRLLQFGTLFGTARLRLADPTHSTLRRDVRRAMVFANPHLLAQADAVRDSAALGGAWGYAGVHLRLGDGVFAEEDAGLWNVRHVWWRLVRELGVDDQDAIQLESRAGNFEGLWTKSMREPPPPWFHDAAALRIPHPPPPPLIQQSLAPTCQEPTHPLLNLPLYIATDNPTHPALALFTRTFPCVYFFANFSGLLSASPASSPASQTASLPLMSPLVPPERLYAPFLDALISSKARIVVGTPGSTFSRFVEDVLWRRYHDWEIVQRG